MLSEKSKNAMETTNGKKQTHACLGDAQKHRHTQCRSWILEYSHLKATLSELSSYFGSTKTTTPNHYEFILLISVPTQQIEVYAK